jgi:uncharacterized repeat protein (TIGR03803 family)
LCVLTSTSIYASVSFGENPALNLVAGGNNVFYGIANNDGTGTSGSGAIYSWNTSSNSYVAVAYNILNIAGTPVVANDGSIYVLSSQGGNNPNGALYHIVNGVATPVHVFTNTSGEGANPNFITMVPDGRIYGTTLNGGWGGNGTIFVYNPKDSSFSSPQSFSGANGRTPYGLTYANGFLYGATGSGGTNNVGTLYKWDYINDSAITTLHNFSGSNDGAYPAEYPLSLSNDGNTLMGATLWGANISTKYTKQTGTTFAYSIPDNAYNVVWYGNYLQPTSPVQAKDGTWYQSVVDPNDAWDILAFTSYGECPKGFSWNGANCASSIKVNSGDSTSIATDGSVWVFGPTYSDGNCPVAGSGWNGWECNIVTASDMIKYNINHVYLGADSTVALNRNGTGIIAPTVVFTGPNSSTDQGKNYQNTGINGLAYNPADNSLIATQQWGGAKSDGYINKFIANGLNDITGTDVYDFNGVNPSSSCITDSNDIANYVGSDLRISGYYIRGMFTGDWQEHNGGLCSGGIIILSQDLDGSSGSWEDTSCYWLVGNWRNTISCPS